MSNFPIDFLTPYWPAIAEIDPARVKLIRDAQTLLLEAAAPEVDTSPGTTLGDLHVTPAAWDKAATEIAWARFAQDLDPENARQGTVWNCDFVRAYLGVYGQDTVVPAAWAMLRLVFTSDAAVTVDRSTLFQVNQREFRMWLPFDGPLYLNQAAVPGENHKASVRIGAARWAVDVLIQGPAGEEATDTSALIDRELEGLSELIILTRIHGGGAPTSLQEMARRLRSINNCRQPVTRSGVTGMIITRFPEITSVSGVLSGDLEQVRDNLNPLYLPGGKVDICVKSDTAVAETMTVRLTRSGATTPYYAGLLLLPSVPVALDSIKFNNTLVDWQLVQIPTDDLPGLTGAYTEHQQFYLRIAAEGIPSTLVEGALVADFTVGWRFDPALSAVIEWMKGAENRAVGIDLLPRWFTPYVITSLDVWYNRKAGTVFNREQARSELLQAFNLHCPDSPAGSHRIGDILFWAGAHSLHRITFSATLRPSLASHWYNGTFTAPTDDAGWTAFDAALEDVPTHSVTDLINFDPAFADIPALVSVSHRNFSWQLTGANLRLIERGSI